MSLRKIALANENIEKLTESQLFHMERNVEALFYKILVELRINMSDSNIQETPQRIAKMYVNEVFKGRFLPPPKIKVFPNTKKVDELTIVGPIKVRSTCSHHFVPIIGDVWIGFIPGERLLGISKFARITDWIMSRPHIQEEAVCMLADFIEEAISPLGLGIVMKAQHLCMTWRGVKENSLMTSSVMRGVLRESASARKEFFDLIKD